MLAQAVESYLTVRRACGFKLKSQGNLLKSFAIYSDKKGKHKVCSKTAIEWAGLACSVHQRARRLGEVIRFARYVRAEDLSHELPPAVAVRALEACPDGRNYITKHMLALSTYLGHSKVSATYWYLEATPDLMRSIADRCEKIVTGGQP